MNASASTLTREHEVQSKIRKVSTFSRYARVVCATLFGFGLVGSVVVLIFGILGAIFFPAPGGGELTRAQKMLMLPLFCATAGVFLAMVYQLYRLFGSLAARTIYTSENVRRVRHVGLLYLLLAVIGLLIPIAWSAFVALGFIEPTSPPKFEVGSWLPQSLSSFVAAAVILLISWIMDVGLYEKDHADELQRDADLVI